MIYWLPQIINQSLELLMKEKNKFLGGSRGMPPPPLPEKIW